MDNRTARAVHWLAGGRSAALVAPTVRAATSPAARETLGRARRARDVVAELDVATVRRIAERLGEDREFRRGLAIAASRVRDVTDDARPRPRRTSAKIAALIVAIGVAAVVAKQLRARRAQSGGIAPHAGLDTSRDGDVVTHTERVA